MRLIFIATLLGSISLHAQSVEREVIASGGEYYSNGNAKLSVTIGEPVTETFTSGSNDLTQGFQQTKITVTEIEETIEDNTVRIFPNPSSDFITVSLEKIENTSLSLYDSQGKLVMKNPLLSNSSVISIQSLARGTYFILLTEEGKKISKFELVKQ